MKNKERAVGIIMATLISAAMGIIMSYLIRKGMTPQQLESSPAAPVMYILNVIESIVVGIIFALILPLGKWGNALASKAGATPPSPLFFILNSLPISLVNAICVSAIVCFVNVAQAHSHIPADQAPPLVAMFFGSWISTLIPSIVISYLLSLLLSPIVTRAVGLGGPPQGMPPEGRMPGPGGRGRIPGGPKPA